MVLKLPFKFDDYLLVRKIAQGGMAEVYHAKYAPKKGVKKDVVVKLILPHLASDYKFVSMLIDEASLQSQLEHDNIVRVHELNTFSDDVSGERQLFITMELVD